MTSFIQARNRDAWGTIRGYVYQVDVTIERWLDLQPGQVLELECGEDIDVVSEAIQAPDHDARLRLLEQVKHRETALSLRSPEAMAALVDFFEHRITNPGDWLRFRFVTNTRIRHERPSPFFNQLPAIEAWERIRQGQVNKTTCTELLAGIRAILTSLQEKQKPEKTHEKTWHLFRTFVREADDDQLTVFICSFEWSMRHAGAETLRTTIQQRLQTMQYARDAHHAYEVYVQLFFVVFLRLTQSGPKQLTVKDLEHYLEQPSFDARAQSLLDTIHDILFQLDERVRDLEGRVDVVEAVQTEEVSRMQAQIARIDQLVINQGAISDNQAPFTGYTSRISNFLNECLGSPGHPIPFGGRVTELQFLNDWLSNRLAPPYLLLTAPAGRGKSALLARWRQSLLEQHDVAVIYFPVSVRYNTSLASVIFPTLVSQLARLHNESTPLSLNAPEELWRGFLTDYLSQPLPDGRVLIVLLDGIDEAIGWEVGADLFPTPPPPNLRVVLSARSLVNEREGSTWLDRLGWKRGEVAELLTLLPLDRAGIADILRQMNGPSYQPDNSIAVTTRLYQASEGDPLVLQYLLEEIVRGELKDQSEIQPGLEGIFHRWWDGQKKIWGQEASTRESAVQTLLSILACSYGPLSKFDLEKLAEECGLDMSHFRQDLESLQRFVIGDGDQQGYVFSHPRLSDYFYEQLGRPERQRTEQFFITWGQRILAELGTGRLSPRDVSPYLVQYYGLHLEHSGAPPETLLRLVSGLWSQAWEALEGNYAGFLRDVDQAWHSIEQADQERVTRDRSLLFLAEEVRCALCHASINSLAYNIPPELAGVLVQEGIWSVAQGLAYARQSPEAYQRSALLEMLVPYLPASLMNIALDIARALPKQDRFGLSIRAVATVVVAAKLPLEERVLVVRDELDAIRMLPEKSSMLNSSPRAWALVRISPHLPSELQRVALDIALSLLDEQARAEALTGLIKYADDEEQVSIANVALRTASLIKDEGPRAEIFTDLVSNLPDRLIDEALKISDIFRFSWAKVKVQAAFAARLPKEQQQSFVHTVLETACNIEDDWSRAIALAALTSLLQGDLIDIALQSAVTIEYAGARAEALTAFVKIIPQEERLSVIRAALDAMFAAPSEWPLADLLSSLAPYLTGELLSRALSEVHALDNVQDRLKCLAILAKQLPLQERLPILQTVLATVRMLPERHEMFLMLGDNSPKVSTLIDLVPYLPRELLNEALNTAQAIQDEPMRAEALKAYLKILSPEKRSNILSETFDLALSFRDEMGRAKALGMLAPYLPPKRLKIALDAIRSLQYQRVRGEALEVIIPHLPLELLNNALEAMYSLNDERDQIQVLLALAPLLSPELLSTALNVILAFRRNWALSSRHPETFPLYSALLVLMIVLSPNQYLPVVRFALDVAQEAKVEDTKAKLLEVLEIAPYLPEPLLHMALDMARSLQEQQLQTEALVALVKHAPMEEQQSIFQQVLNSVDSISSKEAQAKILASILKILPQDQRATVVRTAVDKALAVINQPNGWQILTTIAPFLPSDTVDTVLQALNVLQDLQAKAEVLIELVKRASLEEQPLIIHIALDTIYAIRDNSTQMQALKKLATNVPSEMQFAFINVAFSTIRSIQDEHRQAEALMVLSSYVPSELIEIFLEIASKFRQRRNQAIALTAIVSRVPKGEQISIVHSVIDTVLAIEDEKSRIKALVALIPQIDTESLHLLVSKMQNIHSSEEQVKILAVLTDLAPGSLYSLWRETLHKLAAQKRSDILTSLIELIPNVIKLGGEESVAEVAQAIIDVSRWWP